MMEAKFEREQALFETQKDLEYQTKVRDGEVRMD
jgi:hypothetical protein